jgi:hypothetical protein
MSQKYVLIDAGRKAWCWARKVPQLSRNQHCVPFEALKALTGVGRLEGSPWKHDPSLLRDATPGFEPSHTDDEALSNIWRAGGYLRTTTFRIPYRSRKYAEKRARTMEAHGLIGRFTDPSPKPGRGPASYVIHLTDRGAERVADYQGVPWTRARFHTGPPAKTRGLSHRLGVAHCVVVLDYACRWTNEFRCDYRVEESGLSDASPLRSDHSGDLCPDAVLMLSSLDVASRTAAYFLEWDGGGGAVSGSSLNMPKTIHGKLDYFTELLEAGPDDSLISRFHVSTDNGFTVLLVTTGRRRIANIAKLAASRGIADNVLLALREHITCEKILSSIWLDPGRPDRRESLIGERNYRRLKPMIEGGGQ